MINLGPWCVHTFLSSQKEPTSVLSDLIYFRSLAEITNMHLREQVNTTQLCTLTPL